MYEAPPVKKPPRFPRAKPKARRKPWAVWLLLQGNRPWNYSVHEGIVDAWATARTLAGDQRRVWLAHIDQPAHKGSQK